MRNRHPRGRAAVVLATIGLFIVGLAGCTKLAAVVDLDTGGGHACAALDDGRVRCWGRNSFGQLGDGTVTDSGAPVAVVGITDAVSVVTGKDHSCALMADGTAACWGANILGQLGNGTTPMDAGFVNNTPTSVAGVFGPIAALTAGDIHTCATKVDGQVLCWGRNLEGQLGDGSTTSSPFPVAVGGLALGSVAEVSAGGTHTCALLTDGTARCWGANYAGQLGDGTATQRTTPVTVTSLTAAVSISAGLNHTCAERIDSTLRCWGGNGSGQLGNGSNIDAPIPIAVGGITDATSVSAGSSSTCARRATGSVRCWGRNDSGQLGNGSNTASTTAVAVADIATATTVEAGGQETSGFACALLDDQTVRCWGSNGLGQLGDNSTTGANVPNGGVAAAPAASALTFVASGPQHGCGVTTAGGVVCWGSNQHGQIGDGTVDDAERPVPVVGVAGAAAVAVGNRHSCALLATGAVRCWGENQHGQLGDASVVPSLVPVTVAGLSDAATIAAGANHTCVTTDAGAARCWGRNHLGQLGDATFTNRSAPVGVAGITSLATSVTAGLAHSCALRTNGNVRCWGLNNDGQLGNGSLTSTPNSVAVTGIDDATSLEAGAAHTCVTLGDGTARCWGRNTVGQLGDGSLISRTTPVPVATLSGATAIAGGAEHTCALVGGGARCWGANAVGQLGNGLTATSLQPVPVVGATAALTQISTSEHSTCARLGATGATCWGENGLRQLGDGSDVDRPRANRPVTT